MRLRVHWGAAIASAVVLAALPSTTYAAVNGGSVYGWGSGLDGQLGTGGVPSVDQPSHVSFPSTVRVASVSAGPSHVVAVDSKGGLWAWGANESGEDGDGTTIDRPAPVQVAFAAGDPIKEVAAGGQHSLLLDAHGVAWAWGRGASGELGGGTTTGSTTPARVAMPAGVRFASVAAGNHFSMALDTLGRLWSWGYGPGQYHTCAVVQSDVPVQVSMPAGITFTSIAGGLDHANALDSNGNVWFVGRNVELSTDSGCGTAVPQQVSMPSGVAITEIGAGTETSVALDSNGNAWEWGYDFVQESPHQNGDQPHLVTVPAGLKVAALTSGADADHFGALDPNGIAWAWGGNASGQLGNGTRTTPQSLSSAVATLMPPSVTFRSISVGGSLSVAIDSLGGVWAWGSNLDGQVGTGAAPRSLTPIEAKPPLGTKFTDVAAGHDTTWALDTSGALWSWGDGSDGQLADGSRDQAAIPKKAAMPSNVTFVDLTAGSMGKFALALDTHGNVWGWGDNAFGQLGDGSNVDAMVPTEASMPPAVAFTKVAAGPSHALAIDTAGHVWAWGSDMAGVIGANGGYVQQSTVPLEVTSLEALSFTAIAGGGVWSSGSSDDFSLAVDSQGTVFGWGANSSGQLGNGTSTYGEAPAPLPFMSSVSSIAAGAQHALAIDANGQVWAWGFGFDGELGNGTYSQSSSPVAVEVPTGVSIASVSAGADESLALDSNGNAWTWGYNAAGQLGNGQFGGSSNLPERVVSQTAPFTTTAAGTQFCVALS